MTLLQFIRLKLEEDTPVGDIARDANNDKEFKAKETDKERFSYLEFACHNVTEAYHQFLKEFNSLK